MLRLLTAFAVAVVRAGWRRLRLGPLRPSWSLGFEVLVEALRWHTRWLASLPIEELRRAAGQLRGPLAPGVVTSADPVAGVPVLWLTPKKPAQGVVIYVHGGGHVFGSAAQDAGLASRLAEAAGVGVAAPDYRLAPEAPCPADIEDLLAVHRQLVRDGVEDIAWASLSSGCGTALAGMTQLRDQGETMPSRAALLSPMVDGAAVSPSWTDNAGVDWAAPEAIRHWTELYAAGRALDDPFVSPIHANLQGLPPLLIVAGEAELLRDDAIGLAERARRAAFR